jgi:superfamily I DNA/RNA helicase
LADNEWRVWGPPGTGKTSYLSAQVRRAAERFGSEGILVTSYTRAGAVEIAGRHLPIERSQIGTLHAHAYRALGSPQIAETHLAEWNEYCATRQQSKWSMTPGSEPNMEEWKEAEGNSNGDAALQHANRLRAQMIDRQLWPAELQQFMNLWSDWKKDADYIDFTDMIEIAYRELDTAPGNPSVGIADEVQDNSKLELALLRKWSQHMQFIILAGDDDQVLYQFRGCTPDAFLDPPIDDAHKRILTQSYRVPRVILDFSQDWIKKLTRREPKAYNPRVDADGNEVQGAIRSLKATRNNPKAIIADLERYLANDQDIMILGSCSYMVDPVKEELRAQGIPFHNPYRSRRGDWNPLRRGSEKSVSTPERVLAFLRPQSSVFGEQAGVWSAAELKAWIDLVKSKGVLLHGAKKKIEGLTISGSIPELTLHGLFEEDALRAAQAGDTRWLLAHAQEARKSAMEFPLRVIRRRGAAALRQRPKVVVGTVHSVKGAEASVVYLCPDISPASMMQWNGRLEDRDSVIRLFYVGMTRSKDTLVLCQPEGNYHVKFQKLNDIEGEAKETERSEMPLEIDEEL